MTMTNDQIETQLEEVGRQLNHLRARVASLETRDDIVAIRESVERLRDRVDQAEARISLATTRSPASDETDRRLTALDRRLGGVENDIVGLNSQTATLAKDVVERTYGGSYADELKNLRKDFEALQVLVAAGAPTDAATAIAYYRKVEAALGSLINAPLDGQQIAVKAYVDDAVRRIAESIRTQIKAERDQLQQKLSVAYDMAKALGDALGTLAPVDGPVTVALEVARKLKAVWTREEAIQRAERQQTSRLESLVHALTGRRSS